MMNSVERISTIIPSFKQQLIFLEEREKLFKNIDNYSIQGIDPLSTIDTNDGSFVIPSTNLSISSIVPIDCQSTSSTCSNATTTVSSYELSSINSAANQSNSDVPVNKIFPDVYQIPSLPNGLIKDVEDGIVAKFGPHCTNRRIIIDTIAHDLIHEYDLLYPTHKQFDNIGKAIVKFLKLPVTIENIAVWKDALQTKLKRKRYEYSSHSVVQEYRLKYSKSGSGRPVKRHIGTTAERDRYKQMMMIISPHDDSSDDIRSKSERLREDISQLDVTTQLKLWKETLYFRRESIRDRSTQDILNDFPGYSNPFLIFEEVRMLMKIDLDAAVRRQTPVLLNKLLEVPMFITDSPPIRLIKVLCQHFGETVQHTICSTEPPTPYPTLICNGDRIDVYVDFILVVSTNSSDDALALLIAMYTIFELSFDKKDRTVRFLYSVLHGDKQSLSNSIRNLINEKNIDLQCEQKYKSSSSSANSQSSSSANQSQGQATTDTNLANPLNQQQRLLTSDQLARTKSSVEDENSNSDMIVDENETSAENTCISSECSSQSQIVKQRKRQRKNSNENGHNQIDVRHVRKNVSRHLSADPPPLNDMTNSTSISIERKKRRRH